MDVADAQAWLVDAFAALSTWTAFGQLSALLVAAGVALPIAAKLRELAAPLGTRYERYPLLGRMCRAADELAMPTTTLLLIGVSEAIFHAAVETPLVLMTVVRSLVAAWIFVKMASVLIPNTFWARTVAVSVWGIAALNILGLLDATLAFLGTASLSLGEVSVSALTIIQGLLALGVLLWLTMMLVQFAEVRIRASESLTPSIQVLAAKVLRISLATAAFLLSLHIVGVDLTALAIFGGAVGVGLGFGLQKIFANLISGIILLLDKSIKPGDVIAVPGYYGRVDELGARYVSVLTRDGIEHLIPNEELIANPVENWSHSQNLLRLRKVVGVHYRSDVELAIELCLEAAAETPRVLDEPRAVCLVRDFGESSVDLEIRFWIDDPMNGRANVTSEVLRRVWKKFHESGIEIPYPQRDLHLRSSEIGKL